MPAQAVLAGDPGNLNLFNPTEGGAIVSPGEFYGPDGAGHVRIAAVQPDDRLELVADRLGTAAQA